MKAVWTALGALGFVGGAAFLALWVLAWTGRVPPGEPLAVSLGVMLLVVGLFCLRQAADPAANRGTWKRSNVKVGRLSALGFGMAFCAVGLAFVASHWLPNPFGLGMAGVALAGFVLAWCGGTLDANRARSEDMSEPSSTAR